MLQPYCLTLFLTYHRWKPEVQTIMEIPTYQSSWENREVRTRLWSTSESHYSPQ